MAEQAAAALRQAILAGELSDLLPGEHHLARELGISRPSVRAALAQLASDGLVIVRKRHRTRIVATSSLRGRSAASVCAIGAWPRDAALITGHPLLRELNTLFASRGVSWNELFEVKLAGPDPDDRLRNIVSTRRHGCWMLVCATEAMQRWFAGAGLPALVVGTRAPGVNLPSIDVDYGAVGWHAAGMLISRGHRRVALTVPSNQFPGDVAFQESFLRYMAQHSDAPPPLLLPASDNVHQFRAALHRVLSQPGRPTALVSTRAFYSLTIMTSMQSLNLRIPDDVSIVSRDSDRLFEMGAPDLTRYSVSMEKLAARAARIALKLMAQEDVPAKPALVTPTFVRGATLRKIAAPH